MCAGGAERLPAIEHGRRVGRSRRAAKADVAQLAEHVLGKDEVTGSIPVIGSRLRFWHGAGFFLHLDEA